MSVLERGLLTVAQVAEATGFSRNAVYRAIAAGELRASKLRGRLRVQLPDVDRWVEANVVACTADVKPPSPARLLRTGGPGRGLRELLEADA